MGSMGNNDNLPDVGSEVKLKGKQYHIETKLYDGPFSKVYTISEGCTQYAMKIERSTGSNRSFFGHQDTAEKHYEWRDIRIIGKKNTVTDLPVCRKLCNMLTAAAAAAAEEVETRLCWSVHFDTNMHDEIKIILSVIDLY